MSPNILWSKDRKSLSLTRGYILGRTSQKMAKAMPTILATRKLSPAPCTPISQAFMNTKEHTRCTELMITVSIRLLLVSPMERKVLNMALNRL